MNSNVHLPELATLALCGPLSQAQDSSSIADSGESNDLLKDGVSETDLARVLALQSKLQVAGLSRRA